MCNIAILENYSLFCSGIKPVLAGVSDFKIVAEARFIKDFIPMLSATKPDVIIIDVLHCDQKGLVPIRKIKRKLSKVPILLIVDESLAIHFEDYITLGINGLVFCSSNERKLVTAVKELRRGNDYFPNKVWVLIKDILRKKRVELSPQNGNGTILTKREISVLELICKGYTYKEIGAGLNISPRTVETHKKNIASKLEVKSTAEMVEYALQNQLT